MHTEIKEKIFGGDGRVLIKRILEPDQLTAKCKTFAEVTVEPGCSFGYHEHHGESETYYILKGEGEYNDNGTIRTVKPGDMTYTADGCGHGIANKGETDLVFMALVLVNC